MAEGRIMAIDFGRKRVGLAVTDPLQLIGTRLATVPVHEIWVFLDDYFRREYVSLVLIGYPVQLNNLPSASVIFINPFIRAFIKRYPAMKVEQVDERFTTQLAKSAMIEGGMKRKGRQDKSLVDAISATIILQSFLEQKKYK